MLKPSIRKPFDEISKRLDLNVEQKFLDGGDKNVM